MNLINKEKYGQNKILSVLSKFHSNNTIPHALLFSGPDGVGKFFTAINFAIEVNEVGNSLALDRIQKLTEPFIKLVFPLPRGRNETNEDGPFDKLSDETIADIQQNIRLLSENPFHKIYIDGANNIKISSIRDIKKFLTLDFNEATYRFIIILDAHLMNDEAQNAFLKSLEEPPEGIIFVLITSQKDLLLETIRSRCWQINFEPYPVHTIKNILKDIYKISDSESDKLCRFSDGSVTAALNLNENNISETLEDTINIIRFSLVKKYNSAFIIFEKYLNDKNRLHLIISTIKKWIYDSIRVRNHMDPLYYNESIDTFNKFNEKYNFTNTHILYEKLEKYVSFINRNGNLNIIAMNIIFDIASL